jgi:hypothetical protein
MAFPTNGKRRTPVERTTYEMTPDQREEFYRLLFEHGGDVARAYRERFATTRVVGPVLD